MHHFIKSTPNATVTVFAWHISNQLRSCLVHVHLSLTMYMYMHTYFCYEKCISILTNRFIMKVYLFPLLRRSHIILIHWLCWSSYTCIYVYIYFRSSPQYTHIYIVVVELFVSFYWNTDFCTSSYMYQWVFTEILTFVLLHTCISEFLLKYWLLCFII